MEVLIMYFRPSVTSSFIGTIIMITLCYTLNVRDEVSNPNKTGKIIVYICTF
jgi:hypothetical protein